MSRRKFTFPEIAESIFEAGEDPEISLSLEQFGAIDYDQDDAPPAFLLDDVYKGMTPRQIAYAQAVFETGGDRKKSMQLAGYAGTNWQAVESNPKVKRAVSLAVGLALKGKTITAEAVMLKLNEIANRAATEGQYKAAVDALKTMGEFMGLKDQEDTSHIRIDNHGQMIVFAGANNTEGIDPAKQKALSEVLAMNQMVPFVQPEMAIEAEVVDGED